MSDIEFEVFEAPDGENGIRVKRHQSEHDVSLVLNQGEINFLVSHCEASIVRWRRSLNDAAAHKDIIKREHAAGAITAIEALMEKVKAAGTQ